MLIRILTFSTLLAFFIINFALIVDRPLTPFYTHPYGSDLPNYFTGASILKSGLGTRLYDLDTQFQFQKTFVADSFNPSFLLPFRALPPTALLYLPASHLPHPRALDAIFGFSLLTLSLLILLAVKTIPHLTLQSLWLLAPLSFLPVTLALLRAQPTIFFPIIFLLTSYFLRQRKPFHAGLSLCLLLLKPHFYPLPFLTLLLTTRQPKFLLGSLLGLVTFFILSLLFVGPQALLTYPGFLQKTESPNFGSHPEANISLPPRASALLLAGFFLLIGASRPPAVTSLLLSSLVLPLTTGHTYHHDLTLLLFPLLVLTPHHPRLTLVLFFFSNILSNSLLYLIPFFLFLLFPFLPIKNSIFGKFLRKYTSLEDIPSG